MNQLPPPDSDLTDRLEPGPDWRGLILVISTLILGIGLSIALIKYPC